MPQPHPLWLGLTGLTIIAGLVSSVALADEVPVACRIDGGEPVREVIGPCTRVTHDVEVRAGDLPAFPVTAQNLTCAELEIDTWQRVSREVTEACDLAMSTPTLVDHFEMHERLDVLGHHGDFVSVEHTRNGFTGGAHGWAVVNVHTWDTTTGKQVTLRALLPDHIDAIEKTVRKQFAADPDHELYAFDLDTFAIVENEAGEPMLRFVMTNAHEIARGTTLTFDVDLPAGASLD